MRVFFFLGWVMLLAAFAAAGAEAVHRGMAEERTFFMPAHELWRVLWPGSYVIFEARIEAASPGLWDTIRILLAPPAYVILGIPGAILAWFCRPHRQMSVYEEEEFRQQEASLFLFDDLAREAKIWAKEEGEDPDADDRAPSTEIADAMQKHADDGEDDEFLKDLDRRIPPLR